MKEAALALHDLGFNPLKLKAAGKEPTGPWKHQQESRVPREQIARLFDGPGNLGLIMGEQTGVNLVALDFDSEDTFREVYPSLPESEMLSKTPRGYHALYQAPLGERIGNRVRVGGKPLDIRSQGGYIAVDPSEVPAGRYEWIRGPVAAKSLSFLPPELLPKEEQRQTEVRTERSDSEVIEKARRYLLTAGGAVSGEGGHKKTFRLACRLVHQPPKGFGLTEGEAMDLMLWWNPMCSPIWSEKEISHKVADAIKCASK